MVFTPSVSYILVLVLRQRKHIFGTLFLSPPVFSFSASSFCFAPFYSIFLVVYQLSKSVRLLLAAGVSTLLSDLVTGSAGLCVLGTRGTVWRWPLTLIKGPTALFGSYQFNQLAHSCSLSTHDMILSLSVCLHAAPSHWAWLLPAASCHLPFILLMTHILQKTSFTLKRRAANRKLSFILETPRSVLFLDVFWQFKVMLKLWIPCLLLYCLCFPRIRCI